MKANCPQCEFKVRERGQAIPVALNASDWYDENRANAPDHRVTVEQFAGWFRNGGLLTQNSFNRALPRNLSASLQLLTHGGIQPVDDGHLLRGYISSFCGIRFQVIELQRRKRRILQQLPVTLDNGINGFPPVPQTAFATSKEPLLSQRWLLLTQQRGQETATFNRMVDLDPCSSKQRWQDIHRHRSH